MYYVCISFVVGFGLFCGCGDEEKPPSPPRPVKFATIGTASGDVARSFPATIQPRDATQLSFRVGGNLASLNVKMGGTVKKDKLVASLDQGDFKVAVAQAKANFQSAKTTRDTAKSSFRRVEKLFEAGSSSQSDFESAKGQLNSAQAQLGAAGQQVKQAKNQLGYTELRAPFEGIVNSVPVKAGEQVGAGQTVVVVSKGGALEVNVGVPEGVVSLIKVGTPVVVTMSALSEGAMKGEVREVGFVSENSTYPVRIELTTVPPALRPGMAAEARFDFGVRKAGLAVPAAAVGNAESGTFVFLLKKSDGDVYVAHKTTVVLGQLIDNSFELKNGLKAGESVAVAGLATLVDGMKVRLLVPRGTKAAIGAGDGPSESQP